LKSSNSGYDPDAIYSSYGGPPEEEEAADSKPSAPSAPVGQEAVYSSPSTSNSPKRTASIDNKPSSVLAVSSDQATAISSEDLWKNIDSIRIEGETLRTCSFSENVERVEVLLKSNGRPVYGDIELWQGHHNDPQRMKVYLEDGSERSFRAVFECPGSSNSIAIRNTASEDKPIIAGIEADFGGGAGSPADLLKSISKTRTVQGGAIYTTPFSPAVQSIQVCLSSDGRPMNCRVELLQGPNNIKQTMELYTEDGDKRPMYLILDCPGSGNVLRVVNTATVEYPAYVCIEPYIVDESMVNGPAAATKGMKWS
jgi:hypothetical protein